MYDGCFYIFVAYEKLAANWWGNYLSVSRKLRCDKRAAPLYDCNKWALSDRLWQLTSCGIGRFDSKEFFYWFNKVDKQKNSLLRFYVRCCLDFSKGHKPIKAGPFSLVLCKGRLRHEKNPGCEACFSLVLGVEPRALCMVSKYSTSEL